MHKGAQPTYFREPHIICQRAACGSRAAVWPPLLYAILLLSTIYTHQLDATLFKKLYSFLKHTGHTQKNGAVLIVFTLKTAPFFCVCPVFKNFLKPDIFFGSYIAIFRGLLSLKL
jgi:hypothetical protein